MSHEDLAACRRMRACLLGIADLDPEGVKARIAEMDREIARLEQVLAPADPWGRTAPGQNRIEVIPVGAAVRAA
ncbi:MAG: hypothetical protein JWQ36_2884 [Enterovirga sp.]|jgi:hypothetical protein|nr:hypothetical protein [Enterovirga sp.]